VAPSYQRAAADVAVVRGTTPVNKSGIGINDRRIDETTAQRCQFSSAILPAWARRSAQSAALDTQQGGQASRTAADTRRRSNPHEVSTVSMDCYVAWPFAE
jgi:hypothetical protein